METGTPGMCTSAEGSDLQELVARKSAAQVVEVAEDWPSLFVSSLSHRDIN